uniref:Amino acid transporter transmembrane domain-containing protein n=1 Tax=Ditylenchus dipsaci TaxID=166011 RepID=A0A915DTY9_9BILA
MILIVALLFLPLTFLKSPQDFWGAVVTAMFTTAMAVILIVVGASLDYGTCATDREMPSLKFTNVFLAFGTLLFAYGGHGCIPTIQHDMKKPFEFTKSCILAFTIIAMLYLPVCIAGYLTYGDSIRDSIINSVQITWIQQGVNMAITLHCFLSLTIMFNPLMQEAEVVFNVPQAFGIKRVIVRTGVMAAVIIVAETVPSFGPLLDLVGASTMTFTSLILPCVFYLCLSSKNGKASGHQVHTMKLDIDSPPSVKHAQQEKDNSSFKEIIERSDKKTLILCGVILVIAVLGGGAAACSAIREISYTKFVPPCYFALFQNEEIKLPGLGNTHCCGAYQNITRYGDSSKYCAATKLGQYI